MIAMNRYSEKNMAEHAEIMSALMCLQDSLADNDFMESITIDKTPLKASTCILECIMCFY
jgi:hypothetical protein